MNIWITIIASIVPALIVGMASSYLTAQKTIATIESRVQESERRLEDVESSQDERRQNRADVTDRLTRIETQLGLLLDDRIKIDEQS